jgi:Asparagine synthase
MLRNVDMMSMLASIEVRVPLLDERVVELGLSIPHRLKTDGERGKLSFVSWPVAGYQHLSFIIPNTDLVFLSTCC